MVAGTESARVPLPLVLPPPPPPPHAHTLVAVCELGSLWDVVQARRAARSPLSPAEVLHVFLQVAAALEHMHSLEPPLAHRCACVLGGGWELARCLAGWLGA